MKDVRPNILYNFKLCINISYESTSQPNYNSILPQDVDQFQLHRRSCHSHLVMSRQMQVICLLFNVLSWRVIFPSPFLGSSVAMRSLLAIRAYHYLRLTSESVHWALRLCVLITVESTPAGQEMLQGKWTTQLTWMWMVQHVYINFTSCCSVIIC